MVADTPRNKRFTLDHAVDVARRVRARGGFEEVPDGDPLRTEFIKVVWHYAGLVRRPRQFGEDVAFAAAVRRVLTELARRDAASREVA